MANCMTDYIFPTVSWGLLITYCNVTCTHKSINFQFRLLLFGETKQVITVFVFVCPFSVYSECLCSDFEWRVQFSHLVVRLTLGRLQRQDDSLSPQFTPNQSCNTLYMHTKIFYILCYNLSSHVFAGSLSPGAALIVKSCDTNFSANISRITRKFSTLSLWLQDFWKVVPISKSFRKLPEF